MAAPDMSGKVVLVTGANSGIGKETAIALARMGARTFVTARDQAKADAAAAEIGAKASGASVEGVVLNLSSLAAVRAAAADVLARTDRLDVLVNNAGAVIGEPRKTDDGFELTFGANHLGPFLFTTLLLDLLEKSKPSRIVNVSSVAHTGANRVDTDATSALTGYQGMAAYSESKLANIWFTTELARRYKDRGITAYAVHPGGVRSGFGMGDDTKGVMKLAISAVRPFEISSKTGAQASVYCATEPGIENRSGGYFQKRLMGQYGPVGEATPTRVARDPDAALALWVKSEELVQTA